MTMPISPSGDGLATRGTAHRAGQRSFPFLAKLLHWMTAVLVLVLFCSGVLMKQIGDGPMADPLYTLHKTTGAGLFGLVLFRMAYRVLARLTGHWREGGGDRVVHGVLYAALIIVPMLGWAGVSDFGARELAFGLTLPAIWPEGAGHSEHLLKSHAWLAFALMGLVVLHIGVALGDYVQRGAGRSSRAAAKMPQLESSFPSVPNMP